MSAASASVRATISVGTPATSAASRAATRLRMCPRRSAAAPCRPCGRTSSPTRAGPRSARPRRPPRSSPCVSSKTFRWPPKPASASATIGTNQSISSLPSAWSIWSARSSAPLMRAHHLGTELTGYRPWSGYIWRGEVGVGRDLPAATGRSPPARPAPAAPPGCRCWRRARRRSRARAAAPRASRRRAARACARPAGCRGASRPSSASYGRSIPSQRLSSEEWVGMGADGGHAVGLPGTPRIRAFAGA